MTGDDIREEIARLEERIEVLRESIARCRKISLGAKIAVAAGLAWLALTVVLVAPFLPSLFFAAIAAAIGGTVLLGSNATTWTEKEAEMRRAEAARAALIDSMTLTTIDGGVTRLH
jgi:hypothetical protein